MSSASPVYLLDTNVVIHYSRGQTVGKQIEADYSLLTTPYRPLICVVTRGDLILRSLIYCHCRCCHR